MIHEPFMKCVLEGHKFPPYIKLSYMIYPLICEKRIKRPCDSHILKEHMAVSLTLVWRKFLSRVVISRIFVYVKPLYIFLIGL
jgi:hypothetical protein